MSLTKRSPHFDALMEEQRREDELSHDIYREELYLNKSKRTETKPAPEGAQQPTK